MKIRSITQLAPGTLLRYASDEGRDWGDKYQLFSKLVSKKFDKIIKIDFNPLLEKGSLCFAIMGAIICKKIMRLQDNDYNANEFLNDIRYKSLQILAANTHKMTERTAEKFFDLISLSLSEKVRLSAIGDEKIYLYIYDLINMACERKESKYSQISHYKEEEMGKISKVFKESVYLINYDMNKDTLYDMAISHDSVYILKAKEMLFILLKDQDISLMEKGTISHEELANIFDLQSKLLMSPIKSAKMEVQNSLSKLFEKPQTNPNASLQVPSKLQNKKSNESNLSNPSRKVPVSMTVSMIRSSILFPDDVSCCRCAKKVSEFNALFWNYSYFCFECVINPKEDISFLPSSIIQKFLKNLKYDSKEYLVFCPECKSETKIHDYRAWAKPKEFKCGACHKDICVEHLTFLRQCFCYCFDCQKQTLSISSIFLKYCLSCKNRLCEICNKFGKNDCECICKRCGQTTAIVHECKERCHSCLGNSVALLDCFCNKKLCSSCYFMSLQPQATICLKVTEKE